MRRHLHPNLHFKEPLSEITDRQAFLAFAEKNVDYVKQINIRSSFRISKRGRFPRRLEKIMAGASSA
jgi:hypothetical protein